VRKGDEQEPQLSRVAHLGGDGGSLGVDEEEVCEGPSHIDTQAEGVHTGLASWGDTGSAR
jgi:hypothetical protein